MENRSDNFPLVIGGAVLALVLVLHHVFGIFFDEWLKHYLEAFLGVTVAEMIERSGDLISSILAAVAIVWFLYWYVKRDFEKRLRDAGGSAPREVIDPTTLPPRDVSLCDAVWRAFLGRWGERIDPDVMRSDRDLQIRFARICREIGQYAFERKLPIWGYPPAPRAGLYLPIPPSFWLNHEIDSHITFISDDTWLVTTHALAVGDVPHSVPKEWNKLMTNRGSVEKLWPAKAG
jgi:hypothetical protein